MTRRTLFRTLGAAGSLALPGMSAAQSVARKGRLKQGATRGCFGRVSLEEACKLAQRLGLNGLDLVGPQDWPTLQKYGLKCLMAPSAGHSLTNGINRKEAHDEIYPAVKELIEKAAAAGVPNVIVLSGNRRGMSDEQGAENCAAFLSRIRKIAEDKSVNVCLELLNSKVDHKDYQCDHTAWGVDVMKRVDSPRVKLLYDIYHMQIMEGDVIRTVTANIGYIGHFHTAGNPGRHEIDSSQELNYRPVAEAIVNAGFQGYFSHEYSPLKDPVKSMEEAIAICDV